MSREHKDVERFDFDNSNCESSEYCRAQMIRVNDGDYVAFGDCEHLFAQLAAAELQAKQWQESFDRCNDDCAELRTSAERAEAVVNEVRRIAVDGLEEYDDGDPIVTGRFSAWKAILRALTPRDGQGAG